MPNERAFTMVPDGFIVVPTTNLLAVAVSQTQSEDPAPSNRTHKWRHFILRKSKNNAWAIQGHVIDYLKNRSSTDEKTKMRMQKILER